MKRYLPMMILIFSAVIGISFLLSVFRMVWFPPESMGMMMGKNMMFHHLLYWLKQTFLYSSLIALIVSLIWILLKIKQDK
jgi:hypothetical protein